MSSKKSRLWSRIDNSVMNAFAIVMTALPILSIGIFVHAQFFNDPRVTAPLSEIHETATPKLFEEPLVSVTFDDGWQSVYTDAAPLLEKYQIQTTQYILPGEFNATNYLSLAQAKSLRGAGHEIMSHSMTHPRLTDVSKTELSYQLTESKNSLIKNNLVDDQVHFAAPESMLNSAVTMAVSREYASSRNTYADLENGINEADVNVKGDAFSRYNIIGYSVRSTTTPAQIKAALDYTKQNKGWLVLVYHQIDDSKNTYAVDKTMFEKQLQLIKQSGVKPAPVDRVLSNSEFNL